MSTRALYSVLEDIARDTPGWTPVDELFALTALVLFTSHMEGDVIEIGSWCGRSTAALGVAAKVTGHTKIIAVDLFPDRNDWFQNADGTYSLKVRVGSSDVAAYFCQTVWKEPFESDIEPVYEKYPTLRQAFDATMTKHELTDIVKVIRGTSHSLATELPKGSKCRVAFIDGDHSYEAVCRDIRNIEPYLVDHGWICFDDAFTSYDGVDQAIAECIIASPAYELCQQLTRKCFAARRRPADL